MLENIARKYVDFFPCAFTFLNLLFLSDSACNAFSNVYGHMGWVVERLG